MNDVLPCPFCGRAPDVQNGQYTCLTDKCPASRRTVPLKVWNFTARRECTSQAESQSGSGPAYGSLPRAEKWGDIVAVCDRCGADYVSMAEGRNEVQCIKCSYGVVRRVKLNWKRENGQAEAREP